jgi:hypothetical protein
MDAEIQREFGAAGGERAAPHLRIIGECRVLSALHCDFQVISAQQKMRRMINTLDSFSGKCATRALDKGVISAALTRAHTGLAELRPQRSRS